MRNIFYLLFGVFVSISLLGCSAVSPLGGYDFANALARVAADSSTQYALSGGLRPVPEECQRIVRDSYAKGLSPADVSEILRNNPSCTGSLQATTPKVANPTSPLIREVQGLLTAQGYDPGPSDGIYGARTKNAIIQYQRDMGLEEHGRADTDLLRTLR